MIVPCGKWPHHTFCGCALPCSSANTFAASLCVAEIILGRHIRRTTEPQNAMVSVLWWSTAEVAFDVVNRLPRRVDVAVASGRTPDLQKSLCHPVLISPHDLPPAPAARPWPPVAHVPHPGTHRSPCRVAGAPVKPTEGTWPHRGPRQLRRRRGRDIGAWLLCSTSRCSLTRPGRSTSCKGS
jgi:hypothetical protein